MGRLWKYQLVLIFKCWCFFSVAVVKVNVSMARVLSVTRSGAIGDSFEIELESNGCSSCQQYGAIQVNNVSANRCSCSCNDKKKRTFYTAHTGTMNCTEDRDILADSRDGSICDFYIDQSQQLKVLNLQVKGEARLKPNGFCRRLKIAGWKFYFNSSWTSFPAGDAFRQTKKLRSAANFSWNGNPNSFYRGLLIKVMFNCTYNKQTETRCLMFKAEGTHQYFSISTSTPPISKPTYTSREKNFVQMSNEENTETNNSLPTGEYSNANDKKIWIAVSLGLSGLVFIAIIVVVVFLVFKCQRNCKQERTGVYIWLLFDLLRWRYYECK